MSHHQLASRRHLKRLLMDARKRSNTLQVRIEEMGADMTFVQSCLAEAHANLTRKQVHVIQWTEEGQVYLSSPQTFVRDALETATRWTDTNTPPKEGN